MTLRKIGLSAAATSFIAPLILGAVVLGWLPNFFYTPNWLARLIVRTAQAQGAVPYLRVDTLVGNDLGAKTGTCVSAMPSTGGTCDASFVSGGSAAATVTISKKMLFKVPCGTFALSGNPGISVTTDRVNVAGCGPQLSIIAYNRAGTAIRFYSGSSSTVEYQSSISNLAFSSTDNSSLKTALMIEKQADFDASRLAVYPWTGGNSVGIQVYGHEDVRIHDSRIEAPKPLSIGVEPGNSVALDHSSADKSQFIADGNPVITIEDGAILQNVSFSHDALVSGTYGFYWVATALNATSINVSLEDVRWEQSSGTTGYIVYIDYGGASSVQSLSLKQVSGGLGNAGNVNGVYLRHVQRPTIENYSYTGTASALNIDSTVTSAVLLNSWFQAGSTTTTTGATGFLYWNASTGRLSFASFNPSEKLELKQGDCYASLNAAGNADIQEVCLNSNNQVQINPSGSTLTTIGESGGSLQISQNAPTSSKVTIPNNTTYGGENAAGTNSIGIASVDASNNVVIGPGGAPVLIGALSKVSGVTVFDGNVTVGNSTNTGSCTLSFTKGVLTANGC